MDVKEGRSIIYPVFTLVLHSAALQCVFPHHMWDFFFFFWELFHFVSVVVEIHPWIDKNFIHLLFELNFTQQFALKRRELLGLQHFFYWLWVGDFEGIYFLFIRKTICLQSCQRYCHCRLCSVVGLLSECIAVDWCKYA